MLSHNSFLVLCELKALGGKASRQELGQAVDKRGIKGLDNAISDLFKNNLVIENSYNKLISFNNHKTLRLKATQANRSCVASSVQKLIDGVVKMSHPAYRAVVDGRKPRRSPLHLYAERCLSRQDLPTFWRRVGKMTDEERDDLSRAAARLVD
jgi:hypothetical protein